MRSLFIKALLVAALAFVFLTQVAATGTATALAIASVVGAIAPFILKLVPIKGSWMLVITWVVSFVIAAAAELISGEVKVSALQSVNVGNLYLIFAATFGVTQAVFAYFKDHPLGPLTVT
jgi:hypothetical protein